MHGSKRHEMVFFKASADLGTAVTYFIPEVRVKSNDLAVILSRTKVNKM